MVKSQRKYSPRKLKTESAEITGILGEEETSIMQ